VLANQDAPAAVAVIFQVVYDTPQGTIRLTVQDYTQTAAEQGVRCQIGYRKVGDIERRSPPLSLEETTHTEASAAALDGDTLYLRLVDSAGRDLAVTKIDEARWPRDAGPTTVKTVSYWLFVPYAPSVGVERRFTYAHGDCAHPRRWGMCSVSGLASKRYRARRCGHAGDFWRQ